MEPTTQANLSQKLKWPPTHHLALPNISPQEITKVFIEICQLAEQGMGDETDDNLLIDMFIHSTLQKELRQYKGQTYSTGVQNGSGKDQHRAAAIAHGEV